jgi:hypothetical protein
MVILTHSPPPLPLPLLGMEMMSKEELSRWISQLVDYMLLLRGDATKQGRTRVDEDTVRYRVEVKAVDLLRVSNMESGTHHSPRSLSLSLSSLSLSLSLCLCLCLSLSLSHYYPDDHI